jgi:predicted RNA-binding protein with PUA-like domain
MVAEIVARIARLANLDDLKTFETNARDRDALTPDVDAALRRRATVLCRSLVAERTGLDLNSLTPAEEKIVEAVAQYVGIKKRQGRTPQRTLNQIRNRGLLGAAEAAVSKSKPTMGFTALADADQEDLSYEQIVVDHPEEFSPRALWYARRTLDLPIEGSRPPSGTSHAATSRSNNPDQQTTAENDVAYWVFVCNPKKWAIDKFLETRVEHDTWGIRPSDSARFAPGQLAIVRVGVDHRTKAELAGRTPLNAGIYAICEVESKPFEGKGSGDEFWAPDQKRRSGWPTVRVRYLRAFAENPLTIDRLREAAPDISSLLLNGFQGSTFPISRVDFVRVMELLGGEPPELTAPTARDGVSADRLAELEQRFLHAAPEVKERLNKSIERGQIGALVKRKMGFKCQICEALGKDPIGFIKPNGEPYAEAHHVMPVSSMQIGSLSAANLMVLCATHHRQLHYGGVEVVIEPTVFRLAIGGSLITLNRLSCTE